jgi:hypothetical protein
LGIVGHDQGRLRGLLSVRRRFFVDAGMSFDCGDAFEYVVDFFAEAGDVLDFLCEGRRVPFGAILW